MSGDPNSVTKLLSGEVAIQKATDEITADAKVLWRESRRLRFYHQVITVLTILFGVSAPALVTLTTTSQNAQGAGWRQGVAISITALASAAATIRTVLRQNERYGNSALTSIALLDIVEQVRAKGAEILATTKPEYIDKKLFEVAEWGRRQKFAIMKEFVEKDIATLMTERIEPSPAPRIEEHEKVDTSKKN